MQNFNEITKENNKEHNKKWPYIPDHPHRILIIGGSGSEKTRWYWQNLFVCKRFNWTKV